MKVQKSWLSAGLLASIFSTLIAQAAADAAEAGPHSNAKPVHASGPKLDPSVFDKTVPADAEKHQFGAEVSRLLSMLVNNVYTDTKAVIRELLSNAVDAIEKQHSLMLAKASDEGELDDIANYKVVVEVDKQNGILSFTDDGVGMTHDELKAFLGTIAKSGTAEFDSASGKKPSDSATMIGQFGVGFYSVLLVAEKVAVISKSDRDPKQWIWETDASASFRISEDPAGPTLGRGTRVMLKVKSDSTEFLNHDTLEKSMKEYFGYDRHRIYLVKPKTVTEEVPIEDDSVDKKAKEGEKGEDKDKENDGDNDATADVEVDEESDSKKESKPKTKKVEKTVQEDVLISQNIKPIWMRTPAEVKPEEYETLYKTVSGDKYGKPIAYTHFVGATAKSESFRAVLFIPERPPFQPFTQQDNNKVEIKLHVRGVFVTAKFDDFIPKNFAFVKGVVDSDDLSLNISREILQNTSELRGIKKKVVKKIIEMMTDLTSDKEKYKKFYNAYSSFIKLEIAEKDDYRALLAKLLRYKTTKGDIRSLEEYIAALSEAQKEKKVLYYLAGQSGDIEKSPFLGRFKEKDIEVILMTEPVDEHCIQKLEKFEDYKFVNIAKEGIKLDDDDDKATKDFEEKYKSAKEWVTKSLKDIVEKVILVPGPVDAPGSLKSSEFGWTGNMERLIMAQSSVKEDPMLSFFAKQKKILELNPRHRLVQEILERANAGKADKELKSILRTLTDAMMVWSGYAVRDASVFAKGIERLTLKSLGLEVEPLKSEPEESKAKKGKKVDGSDSDADDLEIPSFDFEGGDDAKESNKAKAHANHKAEATSEKEFKAEEKDEL